MKRIAFLVVIVVVALLSLHVWAQSTERAQKFLIHVSWDKDQMVLVCEKGCAWTKLKWGCDGEAPCSSYIDEFGMIEKENAN